MKTNQNMIRQMGSFDVIQRTKDGMFNATSLENQWNKANPSKKRNLDNFWKQTNLPEFMSEVAEGELNIKSVDSTYLKSKLSKTVRGKLGGTWMHPILFLKFAMYLNPRFEYQVIKFVYDQLIEYRHEAGDNYRGFCSAVLRIEPNIDFKEPAKWLNWVVFNQHSQNLRQQASEDQIKDLADLEQKYTTLIEEGYIHNVEALKHKLRIEYAKRHVPEVLKAS